MLNVKALFDFILVGMVLGQIRVDFIFYGIAVCFVTKLHNIANVFVCSCRITF